MIEDRPPRLRKSDLTRQRILDAAFGVIRERGYADLQLSDIAAAAGLKPGSVYYHFDSRDRLVEEVVLLGFDRVIAHVEAAVKALPPDATWRGRIDAAISAHVGVLVEHSVHASAITRIASSLPASLASQVRTRQRRYNRFWADLLGGAQRAREIESDIDVAELTSLLLGALNGVVEWFRSGRNDAGRVARLASRIVFDGIAARTPRPRS